MMVQKEIQQEIINFMKEHEDNTVYIAFLEIAVNVLDFNYSIKRHRNNSYYLNREPSGNSHSIDFEELRIRRDTCANPVIVFEFVGGLGEQTYETSQHVAFNLDNIFQIIFEDKCGTTVKTYNY